MTCHFFLSIEHTKDIGLDEGVLDQFPYEEVLMKYLQQ